METKTLRQSQREWRVHAENVAVEQYDQVARCREDRQPADGNGGGRAKARVKDDKRGRVDPLAEPPPDTPRNPSGTWYASVAAWAAKRSANRAVTAPAVC